jgi:hypothetical protein
MIRPLLLSGAFTVLVSIAAMTDADDGRPPQVVRSVDRNAAVSLTMDVGADGTRGGAGW